jgi:hypothetical protein
VDAGCAARRAVLTRTAKSCGPDASTPASSPAEVKSARPGRQSHIRWMTVTNKPDHRGEHENKLLKPLRAGMPGESGWTCGDYARVLTSHFAREAAGATGTRHSPRPHFSGRRINARLGRYPRRGDADAHLKLARDGCPLSKTSDRTQRSTCTPRKPPCSRFIISTTPVRSGSCGCWKNSARPMR